MRAFLDDVSSLRLPQEMRGVPESDREHVRLLSAHRAKGLEWELVVVASVQEGQWPDVRLRSDLLHVDELGHSGRIEGQTHADLLAEERRLMYVACTRARSSLVVSAVAERVEGGLQASRFLSEIGEVQPMPARSASPMSAEGLITALREAAEAPSVGVDHPDHDRIEALRGAAILRLAALAVRGRSGGVLGPLAPADPTRWWGANPLTSPVAPGVPAPPAATGTATHAAAASATHAAAAADEPAADEPPAPLRLSPSAVASLRDCPLRWFLEKRVGAGNPSGGAAMVGLIVHNVAEALARGDITDESEIGAYLDEIWASVPFPAHYERANERQRVDEMVASLLAWDRSTEREAVAAELKFSVPVEDVTPPVVVAGSIDRVDLATDGTLHVVDFKTGKSATTAKAASENPQLGLYQLAVRGGALDDVPGAPEHVTLGGAELVHVGDRFATGMPKVRNQQPLGEGWTWVNELVVDAARLAAGPQYPARVNGGCGRCAFRYMCPAQAPAPVDQPATTTGGSDAQGLQPGGDAATATPTPAPSAPRSRPGLDLPEPSAERGRSRSKPALPIQEPLWGGDSDA